MNEIFDYLIEIPVPCLIGLCYAVAILFVPLAQFIEYKRDCKKHGKEQANEIWRRMR